MSALQTIQLHTDEERRLARDASRMIASSSPSHFCIETGTGTRESIELPDGAVRLLQNALEGLGAGQSVTLTPSFTELSTQEAANLLNVSRPHLVQLLERGEIPFRMVGSHRRVVVSDILSYKEREFRRREAILDELVAEAQELGLGY